MNLYDLCDLVRFNLKRGMRHKENTIAYKYLSQIPIQNLNEYSSQLAEIDFKLLSDIVSKQKVNDVSGFAIHVRLGDVFNLTPSISTFLQIIKKYKLTERFENCILVTGDHKKNVKIKESANYISELKNKIEGIGLGCDVSSTSADEDFATLATTKCFIAGYRGFSWLAASINPNEVIWDIQDPPNFPWLLNAAYKEQLISGYNYYLSNRNK